MRATDRSEWYPIPLQGQVAESFSDLAFFFCPCMGTRLTAPTAWRHDIGWLRFCRLRGKAGGCYSPSSGSP